jgi:hypothetical protein
MSYNQRPASSASRTRSKAVLACDVKAGVNNSLAQSQTVQAEAVFNKKRLFLNSSSSSSF